VDAAECDGGGGACTEAIAQVDLTANVRRSTVEDRKIVARIEGSDPELKDEAVIVSAHYDHNGAEGSQIHEVFRDLGIAFAAVLVLIYVLVVGWFQSLITPLVIMAAIPFSLVGILSAHGLLNAFFTATTMIGFIAGAGIVVRNSIILVDFIELRVSQGMDLRQAVIDAGAVRFRPMLLTAAAVVAGSVVILFDPIFRGLAIALMAGEIASLLLSRMTVPVISYMLNSRGGNAS